MINIHAIHTPTDIPECMSAQDVQSATIHYEHIWQLKEDIICRWAVSRKKITEEIRWYVTFTDNLAVIEGIIMKGRYNIIPEELQKQALDQLHNKHMCIKKTTLLVLESINWVNMNVNIENTIKNCSMCLDFQQTQPRDRIICHEILGKPWEITRAEMFLLHNKNYLCNVDNQSKFPVIKKTEILLADGLTLACKAIFSEYELLKKIMSDAGSNFILENLWEFYKSLNIEQAV